MLAPHMEPSIDVNNEPYLTIITRFIQSPQALKTPTMEEFVAAMTA